MTDTRIDMGPCDCPGTPHGRDWAEVKGRLNYGDLRRIGGAGMADGPDALGMAQSVLLWRALTAWSKTDERGQPIPIIHSGPATALTIEAIEELSGEQAEAIVAVIDQPAYYKGGSLPPVNGEPSLDGSEGSPI